MNEREFTHKRISSYEDRLNTCRTRWHTILYFSGHLYEYDFATNKINPFNGIKWYKIDEYKFCNVISWIKAHRKGTTLGSAATNINDNIVAVDLTTMDAYVPKEELEEFHNYIKDIYDNWNKFWLFALNNYDEFKDIV